MANIPYGRTKSDINMTITKNFELQEIVSEQQHQMRLMQNMISSLQNQVQEQSKIIASLKGERGRDQVRDEVYLVSDSEQEHSSSSEVQLLLSDDWVSDSEQECSLNTQLQTLDKMFNCTISEIKKDSCLNTGPIRMMQYSEKAFVVIGDTKNQSTSLKKMGGKWNIRLTYKKTGEKFMGWVFTNYKKEMVGKWIDSL